MCRLNDKILDSVVSSSLESLVYVVDLLAVTRIYMIDDDLGSKRSSDRPVRVGLLKRLLNAADVLYAAVVERSTEAYYQKLVLAYIILIERIVK